MKRFNDKMFHLAKSLPAAVFAAAVLLFAVYAPPAHAQTTSVKRSKLEKKEENGVIVIEGELIKAGTFIFRDNIVTYKHENRSGYPDKLRIDGKEFKKDKQFELGFMPDFDHAEILEQECGGKTALELNGDELLLFLDQRKVRDKGKFRIVLSLVDPEQGVQLIDESQLNRKPKEKMMPTKMDLVKTEKKTEEPPAEQETGRRILPSKMDLVRIEHEDVEQPAFVLDPVTGRKKRPSKMDLLTMKRRKLPDAFLVFWWTRPVPSFYPTRKLIYLYLKVPKTIWSLEDEEYDEEVFRMDRPWFSMPTDEEVRAEREMDTMLLLNLLERLKKIPE